MRRLIDLTDRLYCNAINAGDRNYSMNHNYRESGTLQTSDTYFECKDCRKEICVKQGLTYKLFRKLHQIDEGQTELTSGLDKKRFLRLTNK